MFKKILSLFLPTDRLDNYQPDERAINKIYDWFDQYAQRRIDELHQERKEVVITTKDFSNMNEQNMHRMIERGAKIDTQLLEERKIMERVRLILNVEQVHE